MFNGPQSSSRGALYALLAAALFGLSTPLAKLLLAGLEPLALSGLLYLGAALGLLLWKIGSGSRRARRESGLRREDLPLLAAVVAFGSLLGPVLMLYGLQRVSAVAGSLLLNLEAPLTVILAVGVFGDYLDRRGLYAVALVLLGALLLSYQAGDLRTGGLGAVAIGVACLCWALDNNLSERLALRDPLTVALFKSAAGGLVTLCLVVAAGQLPRPGLNLIGALGLGVFGLGLSLVLVMKSLRLIGAAREAAYFATAPFFGAAFSLVIFRQWPRFSEVAAAIAMAAGVILILSERHGHPHLHMPLEHEHRHSHDEHHRHHSEEPLEPHSHPHRHPRQQHSHPHLPDLHHRHSH